MRRTGLRLIATGRSIELRYPIAVAVAGDGSVFVADYGNNRITKWSP